MGSYIPHENRRYMDFVTWDKLRQMGAGDGCDPEQYSKEELAEMGRRFWTTFIAKRGEGLKEIVDTAYKLKVPE